MMANNNKGWGNGPQESDTASGSARKGWGSGPQESDTASGSAHKGWGNGPQESDTGIVRNSAQSRGSAPRYPYYVIDGIKYHTRRVISDQSGEAVIFEVEHEGSPYALKLYRSGIFPNHAVLQRIMENRGNGLLIDIYAHGVWHDDTTKADYHYEVMEYCSGGSLASIKVGGDEKRLREWVIRMASAIDFAHKKGILHRDIKPANFLFTDDKHTRFVLSDWGLAKQLDAQGRTETDDGRTKIYAAPEMYTYIPGTPTYVGPKADFFSLGMTLMALWMGEGHLLADEHKLVHDKQEETLPYPRRGEMSDRTLGLIKALTRRNPDLRAGFDDVVRWSKGESIFKDNDESTKEFKIVFHSSANLIAHNPRELSDMMWNNRDLAIQYLYKSGDLAKWFRKIERPELAVEIEDITENRFPGDCNDGLYVACLTLNPDMPFTFMSAETTVVVNGVKDVTDGFINGKLDIRHLPRLESKVFKTWLAVKDRVLAGKAMEASGGWATLYAIMPDKGYDFKPIKESTLVTPEQLGQRIADEISGNASSLGLVDSLGRNFATSRLCAYLWSKGIYEEKIKRINYCLEFDSNDNQRKFVPYTQRIAAFKAAAYLMGGRPPELKIGSYTFRTLEDVENADTDTLSTDQQDIIADWLALFFQEKPGLSFADKSYLEYTSEYSDFLDNLPKCTSTLRCCDDVSNFEEATDKFDGIWHKISRWRRFAAFACFIPLLLVVVTGIWITLTMGAVDISNALDEMEVGNAIGGIVGVIVFFWMIVILIREGDEGCLSNILSGMFGGIFAGGLAFGLIKLIVYLMGFIFSWIMIVIFLTIMITMSIPIFFGEKKKIIHNIANIEWNEVVERHFIGIRFDSFNKVFSGVPTTYVFDVLNNNIARSKKVLFKVRRNALIMLAMTLWGVRLCWCLLSM